MTKVPAFNKVIRPGSIPYDDHRGMSIFCKIEWDGMRLSISGAEGPKSNGDALGSCGQIEMHLSQPEGLKGFIPAEGWTLDTMRHFLSVWNRWHLNDMTAGSPAQEAHLRKLQYDRSKNGDHYEWALRVLGTAGLQPDSGYSYGSAWLSEEVPEDVLVWLQALPDADRKPAWV